MGGERVRVRDEVRSDAPREQRTARSGTPPPKTRTLPREPGAKPGRSPDPPPAGPSAGVPRLAASQYGNPDVDVRMPGAPREFAEPRKLSSTSSRESEVAERRGTMPVGLTVT